MIPQTELQRKKLDFMNAICRHSMTWDEIESVLDELIELSRKEPIVGYTPKSKMSNLSNDELIFRLTYYQKICDTLVNKLDYKHERMVAGEKYFEMILDKEQYTTDELDEAYNNWQSIVSRESNVYSDKTR